MSRLATEDLFSGRTGTGRLSYPMTSNFSVLVHPQEDFFEPGTAEIQPVTVSLHHRQDTDSGPARPALDIALDVQRRRPAGRQDLVPRLAGWLANERIELRFRPIKVAAGRALVAEEEAVRQKLEAIVSQAALSRKRYPGGLGRAITRLLQRPKFPQIGVAARVLELPIPVARSKDGKSLLETLRKQAVAQAGDNLDENRGASLEAATVADQLLSTDECTHRLMIIGATALASEGQPIVEWDVWRLDLIKGRDWRLVAVECSVDSAAEKEEKDRAKLERLRKAFHKRFSDLREYRTLFAHPENGELKYADASRGFKRDP